MYGLMAKCRRLGEGAMQMHASTGEVIFFVAVGVVFYIERFI